MGEWSSHALCSLPPLRNLLHLVEWYNGSIMGNYGSIMGVWGFMWGGCVTGVCWRELACVFGAFWGTFLGGPGCVDFWATPGVIEFRDRD